MFHWFSTIIKINVYINPACRVVPHVFGAVGDMESVGWGSYKTAYVCRRCREVEELPEIVELLGVWGL